jgi:hypothetical protein
VPFSHNLDDFAASDGLVSLRVGTLRADDTPAAAIEVAIELLPAEADDGAASLRSLRVTTGNDGD